MIKKFFYDLETTGVNYDILITRAVYNIVTGLDFEP